MGVLTQWSFTRSHLLSKEPPQHKQLLAASQSEGNVEFSSALHTRGEQTEEECRSAPTHRKANTPATCQSLREESDLADRCRDGHRGAGGIFSPLCPPQSLKGCYVVNNTAAFIHWRPHCVLWMGGIMRGRHKYKTRKNGCCTLFLRLSRLLFAAHCSFYMYRLWGS